MSKAHIYKNKLRIRAELKQLPTITAKVRAAALILKRYTFLDIEDLLPKESEKRIRGVIKEFGTSGEHRSLRPGFYEYMPRKPTRTFQDVIWHLVRSSRHFETDELERMSGAKRRTVLEYLNHWRHENYLRKIGTKRWQLINDPGPGTPVNVGKREKLKDIRQKAKGKRQK